MDNTDRLENKGAGRANDFLRLWPGKKNGGATIEECKGFLFQVNVARTGCVRGNNGPAADRFFVPIRSVSMPMGVFSPLNTSWG